MAIGTALLNARRHFIAAAWAPVLNNVVVITILLLVGALDLGGDDPLPQVVDETGLLLVLGLGTTAGIVAMTVALLPPLRRAGVHIRFRPDWRHPAVRKALALSGWTIGYVIANQVAAQTVNVLAEPGSGDVTNYNVAFMFFQLPHGLLAVSLMTTFQPDLARAAVHARLVAVQRTAAARPAAAVARRRAGGHRLPGPRALRRRGGRGERRARRRRHAADRPHPRRVRASASSASRRTCSCSGASTRCRTPARRSS